MIFAKHLLGINADNASSSAIPDCVQTLITMHSVPTCEPLPQALVAQLHELFEEKIVFNRVMGLKVTALAPEGVSGRIVMRPELIGHYAHQRMHGGVTSAALDAMAGLAIVVAMAARQPTATLEKLFAKLGTIDLRIDYLRPAIGPHFDLHAQVLRLGSRVANTRMECRGADGELLATGSGAYIVA